MIKSIVQFLTVITSRKLLSHFTVFCSLTALDQPPPELHAYASSTTCIAVSWTSISFESLRGYVIFYTALTSSARRKRRSVPATPELNVTLTSLERNSSFLTGLNEFYIYSVESAGFTDFEIGPRTNTVYIITNQTGE